ncbi:MAG: hypothetical protein K2K01_05010, partial [Eubacterium sp.]|nr:hypothetical protein [Eubacterium sp.]
MDKEKYLEILDTFIPSVEMREYLATQELSDRKIADIILGAPVPLHTKLKYATGEDYEEITQVLDEKGEYICTYRFILIEDEVCYFDKPNAQDFEDYRFFVSTDLNLPVPFKVGDVVKVDCRPFVLVKEITITAIGDNKDCCSSQAK